MSHRMFVVASLIALSVLAGPSAAEDFPVPKTVADGAKLVEVYAADSFFEGPTWDPKGGKLYFTSFAGKETTILRLEEPGKVTVWAKETEGTNGTYLSNDGRMLGAQAYGHRVLSYPFGGENATDIEVLAKNDGWNQPNDVCQTPAGHIYFTDPDFKNRKTSAVYVLKTDGTIAKVIDDMPVPNGVIASNDGKTLYVGDSHEKHWRAYPIAEDGTVGAGQLFFDPKTENRASPDGMSIDEHGNLYLSGRGGVWVASPKGESLGLIAIPEFCSNVTFGGTDGRTLYMTCSKKVYSLKMNVRGGQFAD